MESNNYPGSYYQPLFDLLNQEHGITPLESEMTDIIEVVEKMRGKQPGPRWVKASERLPGFKTPVKWRLEGIERNKGKATVIYMANGESPAYLPDYEWLDEQPAAGREDDAVEFAEELWDNHSVLICEDIFTLEQYANREVMKKDDFMKAIAAFKQQNESK